MTENPSHIVKKSTLVKDRVGCARTSTYNLPHANQGPNDPPYTYGRKTALGPEGAGESKFLHKTYLRRIKLI